MITTVWGLKVRATDHSKKSDRIVQARTQEFFFRGRGQNLQKGRNKVALFLFSDAKSMYIGKYRLTLICSIVADGRKKTEASKVRFKLRLCS